MKPKNCPICGSDPVFDSHDLGRPNGRGYPGCISVTVMCPRCDLVPHGSGDTVYAKTFNDAHQNAVASWNKQVLKVERFLAHKVISGASDNV